MRTIRHLTRSTRTRLGSARRDQRGITTAEYAVGRWAAIARKHGLICDNAVLTDAIDVSLCVAVCHCRGYALGTLQAHVWLS